MSTFTAPSLRINARLDSKGMQHLASLKATIGGSVSDILRDSLAMYDAATSKKKPAPGTALRKIIGKYSSGDPNASVNYKAHFGEYLNKKYPKNYE